MSDAEKNIRDTGDPNIILREHVYDGIEEYDQKLPNWWLFTLYIAIVYFVIFWLIYYKTPWIQNDQDRIESKIAAIEDKRLEALETLMAKVDDASLWEMSQDPKIVAAGEDLFAGKCVACHGADLTATLAGTQLPGLPLNDAEWKHGGNPMDVFNIITNGAPDITKGMVPWKTQMSPADIAKVTAFVMSHHEEGEEWTKAPDAPAE